MAVDPQSRHAWADVWLRFKARPGRTTYTYAPTLLSRSELQSDLRDAREAADESEEKLPHLKRLEEIHALLVSSVVYVDFGYPDPRCPDIYTAAEAIDRREAEAMLGVFVATLGFHQVKFTWTKPSFLILPC